MQFSECLSVLEGKDSGGAGFCWCPYGLQAYGGLWGCCSQGDGGCDKVAPELRGASPTEFQVAPHTLASMSWQGLITVIFIIVSWSMACSLPDDWHWRSKKKRTGTWLERACFKHLSIFTASAQAHNTLVYLIHQWSESPHQNIKTPLAPLEFLYRANWHL